MKRVLSIFLTVALLLTVSMTIGCGPNQEDPGTGGKCSHDSKTLIENHPHTTPEGQGYLVYKCDDCEETFNVYYVGHSIGENIDSSTGEKILADSNLSLSYNVMTKQQKFELKFLCDLPEVKNGVDKTYLDKLKADEITISNSEIETVRNSINKISFTDSYGRKGRFLEYLSYLTRENELKAKLKEITDKEDAGQTLSSTERSYKNSYLSQINAEDNLTRAYTCPCGTVCDINVSYSVFKSKGYSNIWRAYDVLKSDGSAFSTFLITDNNFKGEEIILATTYNGYPVKVIVQNGFSGMGYNRYNINFPSLLEEIEKSGASYLNCTPSFTIPKTLKKIGEIGLYNSNYCTKIYYGGTYLDWQKIEKGSGWADCKNQVGMSIGHSKGGCQLICKGDNPEYTIRLT